MHLVTSHRGKTEVLQCATTRRQHHLSKSLLSVDETPINPVQLVRDLSVFIDADLVMRTHIQQTVSRCSIAVLRQLRSICHSTSTSTLQTLIVSWYYQGCTMATLSSSFFQYTFTVSYTVGHERCSTARFQLTFLGPHLRCSSQLPLALVAQESDVQGCCADFQSHTLISTNIPESTVV